MEINPKIIEILNKHRINIDEGILYLMCIYFKLDSDLISDQIKVPVKASEIIDFEEQGYTFKIPLFTKDKVETAWEWVNTEYLPLFAPFGKAKNKREALLQMKKLFSENPEIRKEDVLGATKMYLDHCVATYLNPKYVRLPHYFISKDKGANRTQDILDWIDNFKESQDKVSTEASDDFNKLL